MSRLVLSALWDAIIMASDFLNNQNAKEKILWKSTRSFYFLFFYIQMSTKNSFFVVIPFDCDLAQYRFMGPSTFVSFTPFYGDLRLIQADYVISCACASPFQGPQFLIFTFSKALNNKIMLVCERHLTAPILNTKLRKEI